MEPYEKSSVEELFKELDVLKDQGLSDQEVVSRRKQFGENIIEEKESSIWLRFFSFFWGPMPWMIEFAAFLSLLLRRWPDFIMIFSLLLINALLSFFQEYKANRDIAALKQQLALKARVLRGKKWKTVEARELVPGDLVCVQLGCVVPADLKLYEGPFLSVDQSALTGESLPVSKKVGEVAYSGTIVKMGQMLGIVCATGFSTFFGKTAKLVKEAKQVSHFQAAVFKIGRLLMTTTLVMALFLLIIYSWRTDLFHHFSLIHFPEFSHRLGKIVVLLLVFVIAGIPVALTAVLSMTMSIGAVMMAKLRAIVSKLTAIEELAGIDVFCSDKTGTLTKNQLTLGEVVPYQGTRGKVLLHAALASDLKGEDAIDQAVILAAEGIEGIEDHQVKSFIPFDPIRKRTEAKVVSPLGKELIVTKGAPQVILQLMEADEELIDSVNQTVATLAQKGFRTLGVAFSEGGSVQWTFLGILSLFDPPREDTKETIEAIDSMGVSVKMITGDHSAIARETSFSLGLGTNIVSAKQLFEEDLSGEEYGKIIESADGFSEVYPEHKFNIIKHLQKSNHIVGMTGDGVNDAPALKQADIGIAVHNATDAARSAADLILTKPGLMVIEKAVGEARRIFGRMKSYVMYRISETFRLLLFVFFSMFLFSGHIALTPMMILLIALLNDLPIMMIAYDKMKVEKFPVSWNMHEIFMVSIGLAVVGVVSSLVLYWMGIFLWHLDYAQARTLSFLSILCGGNLTIYLTRNQGKVLDRPLPDKKFFLATLFTQVVGTGLSVYGIGTGELIGLGWKYVILSWVYMGGWFVVCKWTKAILYKIFRYEQRGRCCVVGERPTKFSSRR